MEEELTINILNKEEVMFSLGLSTTIQEIIEFLVESFCDHFSNVPIQNIIVKSQNQKILLPNQTIKQVLTQEKIKKLNVEVQQQNIQQPQNQFPFSSPQQVLDYQKYQGRTAVQPMQSGFENFTFCQFPQINNFPQNHQDALSIESQYQEIAIKLVYQNDQFYIDIDISITLGEFLQDIIKSLSIIENVSLFYNNNPLLNLKQTLAQQNLPNNCTIHLKPYQPINQAGFEQKQINNSADQKQKNQKQKPQKLIYHVPLSEAKCNN